MKIVVFCYDCATVLDSGIVDHESSLLLFNSFTKILKHQNHNVGIRKYYQGLGAFDFMKQEYATPTQNGCTENKP